MEQHETIDSCPHCGGAARLHANFSNKCRTYFVFVRCDVCSATAKSYASKEDPDDAEIEWNNDACQKAIAAWNQRV